MPTTLIEAAERRGRHVPETLELALGEVWPSMLRGHANAAVAGSAVVNEIHERRSPVKELSRACG
ncbi:hypothetical protein [Actinophytocola sp.]|uniref:hypothetical protein n=1 Tax=Actinophytocola sp. TaxID=1872138 RepID=UPI002D4F87E0|nr:hypothetical protein [Actinophytocola sp.]HYQ62592.1 hypothetical protein [Actinophytocola sp.]